MKQVHYIKAFIIAAVCLAVIPSSAQTKYKTASAKVTVTGTSTIHDWEESTTTVNANADFAVTGNSLQNINAASVSIETKSLKSTKGSLMDNRTYETLKADTYSTINFQFTKVISITNGVATVAGNLTIAGNTQPIELQLTITNAANGFILKGSKKIKMSSHGIKPPSFMLGALKVADEVNINIDLTLTKA
jgi:polyisoprenoid-binding protein YceI